MRAAERTAAHLHIVGIWKRIAEDRNAIDREGSPERDDDDCDHANRAQFHAVLPHNNRRNHNEAKGPRNTFRTRPRREAEHNARNDGRCIRRNGSAPHDAKDKDHRPRRQGGEQCRFQARNRSRGQQWGIGKHPCTGEHPNERSISETAFPQEQPRKHQRTGNHRKAAAHADQLRPHDDVHLQRDQRHLNQEERMIRVTFNARAADVVNEAMAVDEISRLPHGDVGIINGERPEHPDTEDEEAQHTRKADGEQDQFVARARCWLRRHDAQHSTPALRLNGKRCGTVDVVRERMQSVAKHPISGRFQRADIDEKRKSRRGVYGGTSFLEESGRRVRQATPTTPISIRDHIFSDCAPDCASRFFLSVASSFSGFLSRMISIASFFP